MRVPVRSSGIIVGPNRLVFGLDNGTLVGFLCSSGGVSKKAGPKPWPKCDETEYNSGPDAFLS